MFPKFVLLRLVLVNLYFSQKLVCDEMQHNRVKRIVGGGIVEPPPEDDPVVYVRFAGRSSYIRGMKDFPNYVFKGIRFGEKPTGRDRFVVSKHFDL